MNFESSRYQVKNIIKKTKAKGFSNIEIGDELWFSIDLKNTLGSPHGGLYSLSIRTRHYGPRRLAVVDCIWENSQNDFLRFISNFELEVLEWR